MKNSLHGIDRLKVAKTVGLSLRYFSRVFKAETGTTFEKYLLQLRLEKARDLLRYTALPIKQVGQEAGFGSSAYFFEAFKRMSGLAPERYRKTMTEPRPAGARTPPPREPRSLRREGNVFDGVSGLQSGLGGGL